MGPVVGVSRCATPSGPTACGFSLAIYDLQGQGLILAGNEDRRRPRCSLGFSVRNVPEDPDFKIAVKAL